MELKQLKYFLAVIESGSQAKASVMMSVAQPVLSRHIRYLEDELCTQLLYRNGRGVILTDSGEIVAEYARQIIKATDSIRSEMEILNAEPRGSVSVGMPPTSGSVLGVPLAKWVKANYPKVSLRIQEGYSGHVLEWLATGKVDIAIIYDAPKTPMVLSEPLIEEELLLIGKKGLGEDELRNGVTLQQMVSLPMILPSKPHGLRILVESFAMANGATLNVEFEIDALSTCVQSVQQGLGYTILPFASVAEYVSLGELFVAPIKPKLSRQLMLATSTQRPVSKIARSIIAAVHQIADELTAKGLWER
ncbi:LysR substrate-binding domain-containing protein [Martelella soudanensis]|uniref:LysR substrate-binding domain-containing protein n=1 Tax=unclassified Martelella TaxID=2629616 RepID=UPI0015DE6349|nr:MULTISPECIES: LysR substrate-binding domain-containing protein [unclassified Martelella]